jgi:hypothetical protein
MIYPNSGRKLQLCKGVPRQNAAESLKIPESGSVIPGEELKVLEPLTSRPALQGKLVIPGEELKVGRCF